MSSPVRVQNMRHLQKKTAAYEVALNQIIRTSEIARNTTHGDPGEEGLKKCYQIAVAVASAFAPLVEKEVLYLVKRHEGAEPPYLIAYPVLNKKGYLEGWKQPHQAKYTLPLYADDEVFVFDPKDLTQVVTWRGGVSDTGVDG